MTESNALILPILSHLSVAIIMLLGWWKWKWHGTFSIAASIVQLFIVIPLFYNVWENGNIIMQAGSWAAPFGITLIIDSFAATMLVLTAFSGLAVSIFSVVSMRQERLVYGYFPIYHLLLMGLNGAFLTGDIFNLYVWFEIIIISSFVLLTLGGRKIQLEGAVKYFTLNMLASIIFLTAIAVLYGLTGSLNMADLGIKMGQIDNQNIKHISALLFLIGFGIKAGVFPFFFWLPASYHTPPDAVSAIFAGLLTKVGVYALMRCFSIIFEVDDFLQNILVFIAFSSILLGGIGTFHQNNLRRIFSYLIICHIGFMIAGFSLQNQSGLSGAIFYMIHDIIIKTNLFLLAGLLYKMSGDLRLDRLGDFYDKFPKISFLSIFLFFALIGIPPLSGFWPKILLLKGSIENVNWWLIIALLLGSLFTLLIMVKVWIRVFWQSPKISPNLKDFVLFEELSLTKRFLYVLPIIMLAVLTLYISLGAENIYQLSDRIADELLHPSGYIETVFPNFKISPQ